MAIANDARTLLSSVSLVETSIVLTSRKGEESVQLARRFILAAGIQIVSFTEEQAAVAHHGWLLYGKGRPPAALNFGDCCTYALAKVSGERLLYKGDDFAQTDIASAI